MRRPATALCALSLLSLAACGDTASAPPQTASVDPSPAAAQADTAAAAASAPALSDWPLFGYDAARRNAPAGASGVTAANVSGLRRLRVSVPGTVDSSPIVVGDAAIMTTTYGKTIAVGLADGKLRWTWTPKGIAAWAGSAQITNASPAADPGRRWVFTASPDGRVHKLSVATGREAGGGWAGGVPVTRDATHEKLTSSFNVDGPDVVVTTGGYIGDAPPYQGHVVTIDRASGKVHAVFNSLCSDRRAIIVPKTCRSSDSAIWGRSGAVVDPAGGLLVTTGNAPFDGRTDWGDSVLRLRSGSLALQESWTPTTVERLNSTDADLGSTSPAVLGGGLYLQGGKDALLHLLSSGSLHAPSPKLGGQLADLPSPGRQLVFTAPAVWHHGGGTTVFVATGGGTAAYAVRARRLHPLWANRRAGTSPVLAGGLLYVFDPTGGGVRVYRPGSGRPVATLPAGAGHWQSPVITQGHVVLPEGNANDHEQSGVVDLYSVR